MLLICSLLGRHEQKVLEWHFKGLLSFQRLKYDPEV